MLLAPSESAGAAVYVSAAKTTNIEGETKDERLWTITAEKKLGASGAPLSTAFSPAAQRRRFPEMCSCCSEVVET